MKPSAQDQTVDELYHLHRGALVDYALPIVGCRAKAEDIVQEAFIRFSARKGTAELGLGAAGNRRQAIAHPVSYLYRIVRNLAIDWIRRPAESLEIGDVDGLAAVPDKTATPEQTVLQRDELRILAEALAELPERTRTAFDLHRLQGRSLKEVANHLGVSVVRAHQLVKDALRHAAARLDAED